MKTSERKKKMLLMMPVLIIPFLTMAFWALGGGKQTGENKMAVQGLNLKLPDPKQKDDRLLDKLSFYDEADKDSIKMKEYMRSDPYYKKDTLSELEVMTQTTASKYNQSLNVSPYDKVEESPEDKVMKKLQVLQTSLNENTEPRGVVEMPTDNKFTDQVDRLENMMQVMNNGNTEDAETKQLNETLSKILDIQHPDRVKKEEPKKYVNEVLTNNDTVANGFYSWDNEQTKEESNAITAVVNENQTLVNGAVIKLRLTADVFINKSKIAAGNFIFGIVQLNGERLEIEIPSIKCKNSLFEVNMEVYDMDGLPGIYIPGAISRDAAKQGIDNSLQLMELSTLDPSVKAQATAAGIGTIKNLLSRKVKLVKVMVKTGYKVLLRNKTNQQ